MAPNFSRIGQICFVTLTVVALAAGGEIQDFVCNGNGTCPPTQTTSRLIETTNIPEPRQWGLHQICQYPRLTQCTTDTSTGFMEDAVREFYNSWDKNDPRREFIELELLSPVPGKKDPRYAEWDKKSQRWMASISRIAEAFWNEQQKFKKEHPDYKPPPEPTLDPIYNLSDDDPRNIWVDGVCCPPDWPCMATRFTKLEDKVYCYNARLTSYLISEPGGVFNNHAIINIKDFTYTRGDGKVFDFIPPELKKAPNNVDDGKKSLSGGAETSSDDKKAIKTLHIHKATSTSIETTSTGIDSTRTKIEATNTEIETIRTGVESTTRVSSTSTAPTTTESGSMGSKVDTKHLPFFGAFSLFLADICGFMVL